MMDEANINVMGVRLIIGDQGEKRGIAFIDVESNEIAEAALALNNHELKGQRIRVYISKPPELSEDANQRTVYVSGLP